jgi:cytochrome c-type biogenesis protein CcmH/NrfF
MNFSWISPLFVVLIGIFTDLIKDFRRRKNSVKDDNTTIRAELKRLRHEVKQLKGELRK